MRKAWGVLYGRSHLFRFETMWVGARICEKAIKSIRKSFEATSLVDTIEKCGQCLTSWSHS